MSRSIFKPDNRTASAKPFIAWDIETYDYGDDDKPDHRVRGIGAYDIQADSYKFYNDFDLFWRHIRKHEGYIYYAHNAGRFDNLFFIQWLLDKTTDEKIPCHIIPSGSRVIILRVAVRKIEYIDKRTGKQVTQYKYVDFYDSYAILPTSLAKLLDAYGLAGDKGKVDYSLFWNDEYWETIGKPYLEQDCRSLAAVIKAHNDKVLSLGGKIKPTLASTAMGLYRATYMPCEIYRNEEYNDLFRHGYIGGRVEVFRKYMKHGYCYDINSLYPYAMASYQYPVGPVERRDSFQRGDVGFILATVTVKPETYIPVLPYRKHTKKGNKIIFPVGRFSGMFTIQEFEFALDMGQLDDYTIHYVYVFETTDLFSDYVETLYDVRLHAESKFHRLLYKLWLNSLYGKFAQRESRQSLVINPHIDDIESGEINPYVKELNIWSKETERDASYIIVSIGAMITGYTRLTLAEHLIRVHNAGYEIYYCDTDSIYTNAPPDVFAISDKLGDWKQEYEIVHGDFLYPKTYRVQTTDGKWIIKSKGLRINPSFINVGNQQIEIDSSEVFERFIDGELIEQQDLVRISPLKASLKRDKKALSWQRVRKQNRGPAPKRTENGALIVDDDMPQWMHDYLMYGIDEI